MFRSFIAATLMTLGSVVLARAEAEPFRFVAMGDLPYNMPEDLARFDTLIDQINQRRPAFSVHVGDTKSGSSPCTDAVFELVHSRFMQFDGPLIYTPGDNEWTDCHRKKAGDMDPLERLDALRKLYFPRAESLGRNPMPYARQSDGTEHKQMVENAIWTRNDVLFATAHIVGSNNNLGRNDAADREYKARDRANRDWLKTAFNEAERLNAKALVLIFHAELHFEKKKARTSKKSGFRKTLTLLAKRSIAFERPVLLVHGDTHELVIDRPLRDSDDRRIPNVTRLEVMGGWDVGAVEVRVDTSTNAVFSFTPINIPPTALPISDR